MPADAADNLVFCNRPGRMYWVLAIGLVVYVALCTGNRDNKIGADAWEHHRAILALTLQLWRPGNPTQASDQPSIRYSPSNVALAVVCRTMRLDPYNVLSAMAVLNTILLVAGVAALLAGFGRAGAAGPALLIMVSLYGGAPGYANSYALSDLPWHQVNPSALSFALSLIMMAVLCWVLRGGRPWLGGAVVAVLLPIAVLDHAMTGAFAIIGMSAIAWMAETAHRKRAVVIVCVAVLVCAAACVMWPWFDFPRALRSRTDLAYLFNPSILKRMLFVWCMPAIALSAFGLLSRDRWTVLTLFTGAAACFVLAIGALIAKSPALARLPLPGLVFLHLVIALYADEARLFELGSWPSRLRGLFGDVPELAIAPITQTAVAGVVFYFLLPQLVDVAREPHLARPYLAGMLGARNLQTDLRGRLGRLLGAIGERDVVLSDLNTSWAIPSSRGRIVGALHHEFFVPDQAEREEDTVRFFEDGVSDADRADIIRRHDVRWILLESTELAPHVQASLLESSAVVAKEGSMTLMDAHRWLEARATSR